MKITMKIQVPKVKCAKVVNGCFCYTQIPFFTVDEEKLK